MTEAAHLDPKYDEGHSKNPYVNFIGDSGRAQIEARFENGQTLDEVLADLNRDLMRIANTVGIQHEKIVSPIIALKGGIEYAREYSSRMVHGRGHRKTSARAVYEREGNADTGTGKDYERIFGSGKNSIRPTSRSEESGFSIARSMDELKAEVKEAFPGAKVQESGNKLTFTFHESITVSDEELSRAKREHGIDQRVTVTVEDYTESVEGRALGHCRGEAVGGQDSVRRTISVKQKIFVSKICVIISVNISKA